MTTMAPDTRKQLDGWITWALRGLLAGCAWLVMESVQEARAETKDLHGMVESMRTEVVQRLTRVETKLEERSR